MQQYAECSDQCFIALLVLIDRATQRRPNLRVNSHTVHRVLLTCLMLCAKFYDDVHTTNAFYARMGGVTLKELNDLEVRASTTKDHPTMLTHAHALSKPL